MHHHHPHPHHHHPALSTYQHYATNQSSHHHLNGKLTNGHINSNGNSKWNVPGQRSSYSLPHPGHAQSHQRWQKHDDKHAIVSVMPMRHLSNSARNLAALPAQPPPSMHPMHHGDGRPIYVNRPRPASMYDTPPPSNLTMPNSMPPIINYSHHQRAASPHQNGFMTKKEALRHQQQQQQQQLQLQQKQHYASSNHINHVNHNNNNHNNHSNGLRQSPGELVRKHIVLLGATILSLSTNEISFSHRHEPGSNLIAILPERNA